MRQIKFIFKTFLFAFSIISFLSISSTAAAATVHKNKESGLLTWVADKDDFSVELIQLLPDFVRAIYAKHDFPKDEIERIANYCVYGTIIKNTSQYALTYDVSSWRYRYKGESHNVKTKTQWLEEWKKAGILFSWTLLPDYGVFEVGDWQQGFTTIAVPRDAVFDLEINWTIDDNHSVRYSKNIQGIICPPENLIAD